MLQNVAVKSFFSFSDLPDYSSPALASTSESFLVCLSKSVFLYSLFPLLDFSRLQCIDFSVSSVVGLVQGKEDEWNVRIGTEKIRICEDMENSIDRISLQVDQACYYSWTCYNLRFRDVLSQWNTSNSIIHSYVMELTWAVVKAPLSTFDAAWLAAVTWLCCSWSCGQCWVGTRCCCSLAPRERRGSGRSVLSLREGNAKPWPAAWTNLTWQAEHLYSS